MFNGLTEGRIVAYVMSRLDTVFCAEGTIRPGIVVNAWRHLGMNDGYASLTVFLDWENDGVTRKHEHQGVTEEASFPFLSASSVTYSEGLEPRTWHWPMDTERLLAQKAGAATTSDPYVAAGHDPSKMFYMGDLRYVPRDPANPQGAQMLTFPAITITADSGAVEGDAAIATDSNQSTIIDNLKTIDQIIDEADVADAGAATEKAEA